MHIALVPFRLKAGISEHDLVKTSDAFQEQFVQHQDGILRRILVKDGTGGYADVVFFADIGAIDGVLQAEQDSDVCAALFAIMEDAGAHTVYEVLTTYER